MCGGFSQFCKAVDGLYEAMQAGDRHGYDDQLRGVITMAQLLLDKPAKKKAPPEEKETCERCRYADPCYLCTKDGGPKVNYHVGAANTCPCWKVKR